MVERDHDERGLTLGLQVGELPPQAFDSTEVVEGLVEQVLGHVRHVGGGELGLDDGPGGGGLGDVGAADEEGGEEGGEQGDDTGHDRLQQP